jgi:hypothetical protein
MSQCKIMTIPKLDLIIKPLVVLVGVLFFVPTMLSQQIKIDTASVRAVLKALQNPNLTNDQAMTVAKLEGNQGMIKEMHDLSEPTPKNSSRTLSSLPLMDRQAEHLRKRACGRGGRLESLPDTQSL